MIFHPAVMSLLLSSAIIVFMVVYSGFWSFQILRKWDLSSGSETQLDFERRTYLISTVLSYVFVFQLLSLFLFIYTVDSVHSLFVGAMCAAGTLNVNRYGYPLLAMKVLNSLLAGLWLIFNYIDVRTCDYPLVRKKSALLLMIAPLVLAEGILQGGYFLGLKPDIITSCCGSLFSAGRSAISSEIAALPAAEMMGAFYAGMGITFASGIFFILKGKGGYFFAISQGAAFLLAIASLISFISVYIYELPTHHCPFCILQKEYGYIGYLLYLSLLGGAVSGIGAGSLTPWKRIESLRKKIPLFQKRLAAMSLILYGVFVATVTYKIVFSHLRLEG